jgi:molybdate transport system substrate-binding protein
MQKIATAFEHDSGHRLVLSFGATGRFYAQIANGAPFDVLLAADSDTAGRLCRESLAIASTRFHYAQGQLLLWSAQAGVVDAGGDVLRTGSFTRLAIANPKLAPYGTAAMQVINKMQLQTRLQARLVQGESITQAYQFVASGNAALGFVAASQVMAEGRLVGGSAWVVPSDLYAPLLQDAVLLNKARDSLGARALLSYLKSDQARAIMRSHGYIVQGS